MNSRDVVATGKIRLLRAVIEQRSMTQLIAIGEDLLGNPLILCSNNHYIWHSGHLPQSCGIPGLNGQSIDLSAFPEVLFGSGEEPRLLEVPGGQYNLQFCTLSYNGNKRGYSFLVEVEPFRIGTRELHKAFCDIVSHAMTKLGYSGIMLQASPVEIDLIHKLEDPHYTAADNSKLNLHQQMGRYIEFIACRYRSEDRQYAPDSSIMASFRNILSAEICFGLGQHVVAMVPFQTASACRQKLDGFLEEHDLVCGVSYPFDINSDLKLHYAQAEDMSGCWARTDQRLVWYGEKFFQNALRNIFQKQSLVSQCNADIIKLQEYDVQNGTELLLTLKNYLQCNTNIRETAQKLGIHRNSALARVQRIRSLLKDQECLTMDGYFSILKIE